MKTTIITKNNLYPKSISIQSPSPLERVGERKSISIQSPSPLERVGERIIITLFLITSLFVNAQSWQWGKRGGSTDQLDTTGGGRQEEVYGIVTDSNKNIYTISYVGKNNLNVDGNPKTNFGDDTTLTDVCLSSFSCDGTYRWSKIFGGGGYDYMQSIQIDTQDNIYVVGGFAACQDITYPPRIDNDFILPQTPTSNCSLTYIAKFNSMGNLLWIKRPQDRTDLDKSGLIGLSTDSAGTSYVLADLQPGTYANGAFTATVAGAFPLYLLKYDTNGNFISGMYLDMQLNYGATAVKFARNPYNGYYYFASQMDDNTATAVIAGHTATHAGFIWCFNDQGQFQWLKESSGTLYNTIFWYNFAFDPQNNVYVSGNILGGNFESFLGMSSPYGNNPPFVMKLNPTADTVLWSTYPNEGGTQTGAIVLKGNEIGVATSGYGNSYTWGSQTLNINSTNEGIEVLFARLNKDTGACLGLSRIVGDAGYDDNGTAITFDSSGDYILGGGVGHKLTFTTNTIINTGSQSDFFVAKYSTSVCSLSTKDFKEQGFELAPNPVESTVKIETQENLTYALYDITGKAIKQGTITQQENTIDFAQLTTGTYILETTNQEGAVKKVKLLKK